MMMYDFDYRYMVYNTRKGEFQFMRVCETTRQGAEKIFYNLIGKDSLNKKFQIRKVTKKEADIIKATNNSNEIEEKLKELLPELKEYEIKELIKENAERGLKKCKKKKETYLN